MIMDAGAKGLIKKDSVIVEPTSGNTDIFRASGAAGNTSSSTPSLIRRLQSGGNSYLFLTLS